MLNRCVSFSNGLRSKGVPYVGDEESFHPLAILQLVQVFPDVLSKRDFWPELAVGA
jgi:hypothetical protein